MLEKLKDEVLEANKLLKSEELIKLTWGNVSGIDRDSGLVVIKPSGVSYDKMQRQDLVVLDLDGNVVEGELNPSSDTPTHLHLYKAYPQIGGITHTHSLNATAMCQMGQELPCIGTTHADHFYGTVPLARTLTKAEVDDNYELNTGVVIEETFTKNSINVMEVPAVLLHFHAPFTWGKSAMDSFKNSVALESCCEMALKALACGELQEMPQHIQDKHYLRKHGKNATYGQKLIK
ncbi:MAG: L-ribulose-5-phosphate 4-epimerase AraD [Lentisphaeraceae bacterium]|nr:L-ribulose-5-phosphate 4-epimerase AraD [Lentisphaeraceae bacterium]